MAEAPVPGLQLAFLGLNVTGLPMARRLCGAGFAVRGADLSATARVAFAAAGGKAFETPFEAAAGASIVITMLPSGAAVREALFGAGCACATPSQGALVVDMSSSAPIDTRTLADDLALRFIALIDAPVSGGVRCVEDGALAIMVGGAPADIELARPCLKAMGKSLIPAGPIGSGHAVKALNNYVSSAGLQAACEAAIIAAKFGVDPYILVDVLNVSIGRNNSIYVKMKPFILFGNFASAFSMALMAKHLGIAADLAAQLDISAAGAHDAAALWATASNTLGATADQTEIYRYLAASAVCKEEAS